MTTNTLQELEEHRERFEYKGRYFKTEVTECALCGSKRVSDLGHGTREGTIVCSNRDCRAKHWKCWHTAEEWEQGIASDEAWKKMMRAKGFDPYE